MFLEKVKTGTLHFTNHEGEFKLKEKLDAFIDKLSLAKSGLKIHFP